MLGMASPPNQTLVVARLPIGRQPPNASPIRPIPPQVAKTCPKPEFAQSPGEMQEAIAGANRQAGEKGKAQHIDHVHFKSEQVLRKPR
jgi:hypothetical protein